MLHHEYETVVIMRPDLDDADTTAITDKLEAVIRDQQGHMLIQDDWGKRKLAYPIQNHQRGQYVLFNFLGPNHLVAELERIIRIEDRIIRFLTVHLADAVDVPVRLAQAEQRRQELAEAKAKAAAEAAERAAEAAREAELQAAEEERQKAEQARQQTDGEENADQQTSNKHSTAAE